MWSQWTLATFFWAGHGNSTERHNMTAGQTPILSFFLGYPRIHRLSASPPFPTLTAIAIPTIPPMLLD